MKLGPSMGGTGPRGPLSNKEMAYMAFMAVLLVASAFYIAVSFEPRPAAQKPDLGQPTGEPDAAEGAEDPALVEPPIVDDGGGPDDPGGGHGDAGEEPEPIPAEFLLQMQASLQAVEDGSEDLHGPAFDYLIDYLRRIAWKEINGQADPNLADIHPGTNLGNLDDAARAIYQDRWRKARGRFVELEGQVIRMQDRKLPTAVGDIEAVNEVWLLVGMSTYVVYSIDGNVRQGDRALVKGAFYKIRRQVLAGGNEVHYPVLVAKAFGSGPKGPIHEPTREERLLSRVRDLTNTWHGPALYHLMTQFITMSEDDFDGRTVPGLIDMVDIPKEHLGDSPAQLLEEYGESWRGRRGQFLSVTGTIALIKPAELPADAVPGIETVHWGQLKEDETDRRITFVVVEKGEFDKGDRVTLRGAFYKMWRYTTKGGEPHNSPFVVGRSLKSGVEYPIFVAEQKDAYLQSVIDRDAKLHSDSFYYMVWWMRTHGDRAAIEESADPRLPASLLISQSARIEAKDLDDYRRRWIASRGLPAEVTGRLVYLYKDPIPQGRAPEGFDLDHVWSGAVFTRDYQLFTFTALEPGDLQPDDGVVVRGLFFKEWRYVNRKGAHSDTVHLMTFEPVAAGRVAGADAWMMPIIVAIAAVSGITLLGIFLAVSMSRREDRGAAPRRRHRPGEGKKKAVEATGPAAKEPAGPESPPMPDERAP